VHVSAACRQAIDRLCSAIPVEGLTPFSYVTGISPDLNVSSEPPQFLSPGERTSFEPVVFYGSLSDHHAAGPSGATRQRSAQLTFGPDGAGVMKIVAAFGTVIWTWHEGLAVRTLTTLSDWAAKRPAVRVLISLGGSSRSGPLAATLERWNVRIAEYVNQWEALSGADVFLTHHGLNSTHEAIACEVPMLSYPFLWDQPGLAARCQELDLAVPLVEAPMAPLTTPALEAAMERLTSRRQAMARALAEAHRWEQAVVAGRPAVLDRILALA
jgi:hypothetical protein